MDEQDNDRQQDDDQSNDSSQDQGESGDKSGSQANRSSISTSDPVVLEGPGQKAEWKQHPDATLVTETSSVNRAMPAYLIPIPLNADENGGKKEQGDSKGGKGQSNGKNQGKHDEDDDNNGTQGGKNKADSKQGGRNQGDSKGQKKPSNGKKQGKDDWDDDSDEDDDRSSDSGRSRQDRDDRRSGDSRRDRKPQPSMWQRGLMSAGIALVTALIVAGLMVYFLMPSKDDGSQSSSDGKSGSQSKEKSGESGKDKKSKGSGKDQDKSSGSDETAQTGSSIPGITKADDADSLRRQIEHLSERIDDLGHRLDTMTSSRQNVPPVLRTLQIKVGDLSKAMEDTADMPSQMRRVDNRIEDLKQDLKTLRDRISMNQDPGIAASVDRGVATSVNRKVAAEVLASPAIAPISPSMTIESRPDAAMAEGIAQFKDGNYPEAANIFRKLQVTRPDDARVWYFSALAAGMTTGDWTRSARELVKHGLDCERNGSPEKDRIDAAFTGLSDAQGKKWLSSYRAEVRR